MPASAPKGARLRSLLVALDDLRLADSRRGRVETGLPQRTTLAEQVPALVEADPDRLQPAMLAVAQHALGTTLVERVLLGDELLDAVVDPFVFHLSPSCSRAACP